MIIVKIVRNRAGDLIFSNTFENSASANSMEGQMIQEGLLALSSKIQKARDKEKDKVEEVSEAKETKPANPAASDEPETALTETEGGEPTVNTPVAPVEFRTAVPDVRNDWAGNPDGETETTGDGVVEIEGTVEITDAKKPGKKK